jgi:hypothetical protein
MHRVINFETELFEATTPKPHFINPCCFGEDLAAWLRDRLAPLGYAHEPAIQEDWGWSQPVEREGERAYLHIGWYDETKDPPQWHVSIERRGFLRGRVYGRDRAAAAEERLEDDIRSILAAEKRVKLLE